MENINKKFVSTQEMGSLLEVTRQTIRNWINKGHIKAYHIGQNLKIPVEEAVRILQHYKLAVPGWLEGGKDEQLTKRAERKVNGEEISRG